MRVLKVPAILLLFLTCVSSFTTPRYNSRVGSVSTIKISLRERTSLFSADNQVEESESVEKSPIEPPAPVAVEPEESPYPINLPSPILLSVSMVLAIAGTGSAFDLAGGSPSLGFATTAAIAGISIPLCLFLFYASILKATAETEADDKEFLKEKY